MSEKEQKEIAKKASAESGVKAKEIAERTMKKNEKAEGKDRTFTVVSNVNTVSSPQTDEKKIKPFKKRNRHTEILRMWEMESIDLTVITKVVTDAIQKVSDVNTVKAEWTNVEWAVYLTRLIANHADCVSEEDLYLLHDIMIRCQEVQ